MLLPVGFVLGIAAYARLVQINAEEFQLVLAMNRLRHAYLEIEPGLEPYFSTGHHDDERGLVTTYLLDRPSRLWLWIHFPINTPTIVATVDAALAAAVGAVAFLVVWGVLFLLQLHSLRQLRATTPRFPSDGNVRGRSDVDDGGIAPHRSPGS